MQHPVGKQKSRSITNDIINSSPNHPNAPSIWWNLLITSVSWLFSDVFDRFHRKCLNKLFNISNIATKCIVSYRIEKTCPIHRPMTISYPCFTSPYPSIYIFLPLFYTSFPCFTVCILLPSYYNLLPLFLHHLTIP